MAVAFTSPEIGRYFLVCHKCARLRPYYRVVLRVTDTGGHPHCPGCGSREVRPSNIPTWKGAWALFVVGYFWRHLVLGYQEQDRWDPRMPERKMEHAGFAS